MKVGDQLTVKTYKPSDRAMTGRKYVVVAEVYPSGNFRTTDGCTYFAADVVENVGAAS